MIIHNGKHTVYDALIRDGKLFLVSTYYSEVEPKMDIYVNGELTQEVGYKSNEPMKYYWCKAPDLLDITVRIDSNEYHITAEKVDESRGKMAVATLFQGDYHKIETFCKWYRSQGVEKFFLYYNGAILPSDIYKSDDIEYRCWNYPYWNYGNLIHNAQMTFLTSITLRNLQRYDWFGLMDLDELIHHPSHTLIDYFSSVPSTSQAVIVKNHWAVKVDGGFKYTLVPTPTTIGRTKCFYRGTYPDLPAIHVPKKWINNIWSTDMKMIHYVDEHDPKSRWNERVGQIIEPTQFLPWP